VIVEFDGTAPVAFGRLNLYEGPRIRLLCEPFAHEIHYRSDAIVVLNIAMLLSKRESLTGYNEFNFRGHELSFAELAYSIEQACSTCTTIKPFPWWTLRLLSPFSSLFRALLEMRYLWDCEINLSDQKLKAFLNDEIPHTPIDVALLDSGLVTCIEHRRVWRRSEEKNRSPLTGV